MFPDDIERSLAERVRNGDEAALAIVIDTYGDRLYRIAFAILRSEDAAADVVQDALVSIWSVRESIDIARGVYGYLARAVRNNALNAQKHERAQDRLRDAVLPYVARVVTNEGAENLVAGELIHVVRVALDALPPRVREIFVLHREAGLTPAEIAELLDIAPATVHSQLSRAMRRISEAVARLE